MQELLTKVWQWLKESPKWAKIALPLLIAVAAIVVLLSGCGTIGWISAKDTANATISITNSPQTEVTTEAEVNTNVDAPIEVPKVSIFNGSDSALQQLQEGFYVLKSSSKTIRYKHTSNSK